MKRIIILSLLCCVCFCSCQRYITNNENRNTLKGNGNMISQNRPVTPFDAIRLDAPVDVQVIQGDEFSVVIKGNENLCPLIKTTVRHKKLIFYTDEDNFETKNLEAIVTMPPNINRH